MVGKIFRRLFKQEVADTPSQEKNSTKKIKKAFDAIKMEELLAALKKGRVDDPRNDVLDRYIKATQEIKRPELYTGVVPKNAQEDIVYMATDSAMNEVTQYAAEICKCAGFPGYPFLADLAQYSEYRSPPETIAQEMTRKWITLTSSNSDGNTSQKVQEITDALEHFRVRDIFRQATEKDAFFGGAFVFIKLDYSGDEDIYESTPLIIDEKTVPKGSLKGFKLIEPMWVTPYRYNSTNPTAEDFYKPTEWYVLSRVVHASRMIQFVSHEVPDMLKPAYNFCGISTTQLIIHYVENWYKTRNAVNDMICAFSTSGIKTDLAALLEEGASLDILNRAAFFNELRKNMGLLMLDMESEEFFQFNTPLSGLAELQAQSQEQMSAPVHIPLVKMTGITPKGLNASSDGEIQVWYDHISGNQISQYKHHLELIIDVIQLHLYGEIDKSIKANFNALKEMTDLEKAQIGSINANKNSAYLDRGVVSVEEGRQFVVDDPYSGYSGIDVEDIPPPPLGMYDTGTGVNNGEETTEGNNIEAYLA